MTNKTLRVAKNRRESTTPGTRETGKLFSFLLLLSFFFRRASSMSTQSLMMVFARNSSISHRVVHLQRGRKVVKSGGAKNPGGEASVHVP